MSNVYALHAVAQGAPSSIAGVVDTFDLPPVLREDFKQKLAAGGYNLRGPPGKGFWAIDGQLMIEVLKLKPVQRSAYLAERELFTGEILW